MKKITIALVLACCIFGACIILMNGCKKKDSSTTTSPTPTFTCTIDGATFTPTSISGSGTTITATYSSVSVTQEIKITLTASAIGTYSLTSQLIGNSGYNSAGYLTGTNVNALTTYATNGSPWVGTCIITSSTNNVISGTFNFIGVNEIPNTQNTHTIANGSFANITL